MSYTFSDYQIHARKTAIYPDQGRLEGLLYTALGLAGEAGEVANKVKKVLRDNNGVLSDEVAKDLAGEVGDVLWYAANLAEEINYPLGFIATDNIAKLVDRAERGVISGSGDLR